MEGTRNMCRLLIINHLEDGKIALKWILEILIVRISGG
jgi:hypothetical protein